MNNKPEVPKIKFTYKGVRERVPISERKVFNLENITLKENREIIYKVFGVRYSFEDAENNTIGSVYLWDNDPELSDAVKIKLVIVDDYYQGTGAVQALYDKSLELAQNIKKDLVLDCKAGLAAYKSFQKFAQQKGLTIIENERNVFNEKTNSYEAPDGQWTLKIILNN